MLKNAGPAAGAAAAAEPAPHNLILEDRRRMTVTGVTRMIRCDETGAAMEVGRSTLHLGGQGISVRQLSLETGEVRLEGRIDEIQYADRVTAGGFWRRLMR